MRGRSTQHAALLIISALTGVACTLNTVSEAPGPPDVKTQDEVQAETAIVNCTDGELL